MFKKTLFWLILSVVVSLPLVFALLHPGYFPSHDGEWAVVRLGEMTRLLRSGQFPPRWSINLNYGFGYPLFNFTYPLPYFLGTIFYLAKFGLIGSLKAMFFISVPISSVFMFLAVKEFSKDNISAFLGATLYAYLPYRIVDLYVRGSIGESLALALFPIIIWLLKRNKYIFSAVFYAALILTHNIMAVLFTPVILAVMALDLKPKISYLAFFVLSYGLSAFFWIPAIFEKNLILVSKIPIADRSLYFLRPFDLFIPKWGYGVPIDSNGFGYFLGFAQIFLLALLLIKIKKNLWPFFILLSCYLLMLFPISSIIWKTLPLLKEINYPWTLLAPIGFTICLIGAPLIKNRLLVLALILISIITVLPHAKPEKYLTTTDNYYQTNDATTTSSSELMPLWVKEFPSARPKMPLETEYQYVGSASGVIKINQIYFPGWQAKADNKITTINYDNPKGLMEIPVPSGSHKITLKWKETSLRIISDVVSLVTLILIVFLMTR